MRGLAALSPAKIKLFKQAYPMKGSWGNLHPPPLLSLYAFNIVNNL